MSKNTPNTTKADELTPEQIRRQANNLMLGSFAKRDVVVDLRLFISMSVVQYAYIQYLNEELTAEECKAKVEEAILIYKNEKTSFSDMAF